MEELGDEPFAGFGTRLIAKVFQADPLRCRRCKGPLKVVADIPDELATGRILEPLGLRPPQRERPPPEVRGVPLDEEGRETAATAWADDDP